MSTIKKDKAPAVGKGPKKKPVRKKRKAYKYGEKMCTVGAKSFEIMFLKGMSKFTRQTILKSILDKMEPKERTTMLRSYGVRNKIPTALKKFFQQM